MQDQTVKLVVVISAGYISSGNSYQKYCEVNEIKTGKSISQIKQFYSREERRAGFR